MTEERRLIAIGFPLDEAITLCYSMRKEGTLAEFVEKEEEKYFNLCKCIVDEALS